jgi:hypothetical protein
MAINLSSIAEAISGGVNQMVSTSADTYNWDGKPTSFTDNNIEFVTEGVMFFGDGVTKMQLSWRKLGDKTFRKLIIEMPIHRRVVIAHIKRGDLGWAYMYAKARSNEELPRLMIELWKGKPCMHVGVPNRNAMRLLTGLRKRIPPGYLVTKDGTGYPDKRIGGLVQAGLISHDGVMIRGVEGFRTNLLGYEVLTHWTDTRKAFAPFFKAFCPENWERDFKAKQVIDVLLGGNDHPLPPLLRAAVGAANVGSAGGMNFVPRMRKW